jgi:GT2 family glycosyltransferase
LRVLHRPERLLGGGARNRGAAEATGEWIAFVDADVLPSTDWLERLLGMANRAPGRFVVGSVGYAVSGGYWGLANWISEFSEQAPWHPARRQRGGASCNMLLCAEDFRAAGGFPEAYQPGEDTMLFARLTEMGREQWFEPAARVDHYNQSGLRSFARHQYRLGYHGALIRQQVQLRGSLAAHVWPLALGIWIPRLALMARRLAAGGPGWWLRGLALAPGLMLGSWIWAAGFLRRALSTDTEPAA